jgi:hypothetical protein
MTLPLCKIITLCTSILLAAGLFLSCTSEMKKENNLEAWLEKTFPGQFVMESSLRDLQPRNFFQNKHYAVISLKADPEAQFELTWYKDRPDLGLTKEEVVTQANNSKRDAGLARDWYTKLKANGLEKFSVGVIDMALYVLPYGEPDAAFRLKVLETVFNTLKQSPEATQTSIWIECMEDSAYQKEIKDIIPFGYWRRTDTWQDDQKIVSLDFEYQPDMEIKKLNEHWKFNTQSLRALQYAEKAYPVALEWAKKSLKEPYYLEPVQHLELELNDQDPLTVYFSFPILDSKPESDSASLEAVPKGHVTGLYDTDKHTFSDLRKRND